MNPESLVDEVLVFLVVVVCVVLFGVEAMKRGPRRANLLLAIPLV